MSEIKILLLLLFLLLQIAVSSGEFSSAAQSKPRGADSVDCVRLNTFNMFSVLTIRSEVLNDNIP